MADRFVLAGSTSNFRDVAIRNNSTGQLQTGLAPGSSGAAISTLTCTEERLGTQTPISLTVGTLGSFVTPGALKEKTTAGVYQFSLRDSGCATGAAEVVYVFKGTNVIDNFTVIPLIGQASLLPANNSAGFNPSDLQTALTHAVTVDANNVLNVSTKYVGGTLQTARDLGANPGPLLSFTGFTTPATADTYVPVGTLNGQWTYIGITTGRILWYAGGSWVNSAVVNVTGASSFFISGAIPVGIYTASGSATGSPVVAVLGTSTLTGTPQTGDSFARLGTPAGASVSADLAAAATAINNLNNLSALCNIFGPSALEIPASGSIAYQFRVIVRTTEGLLEDLTGSPTIAVVNAAGTDRSGNLSAVTHPSTGVYSFTYTVQSTAVQEGLSFDATGTTVSDSTARHAYAAASVVSIDTVTTLATILSRTDVATSSRMASYTQPTGFLATTFAGTVGTSTFAAGQNVGTATSVTGSVGSISGVTFPANFGVMQISSGGIVGSNVVQAGGSAVNQSGGTFNTLATLNPNQPMIVNNVFTNGALVNAPSGGGGGLTGAYSFQLNYQDSTGTAIGSVAFTIPGQGSGTANASGGALYGLGAPGTYTVNSANHNLVFFPQTTLVIPQGSPLVITGSTPTLPTPTAPGTAIGVAMATDGEGNPQTGVVFNFQLIADSNGDNVSGGTVLFSATSNGSGQAYAQFTKGWTYRGARGPLNSSSAVTFVGQASSFQLPTMLGN